MYRIVGTVSMPTITLFEYLTNSSLPVVMSDIYAVCVVRTYYTIFSTRQIYRLEASLELNGANARLLVSPVSLSPSHPPTPPSSRSLAFINLPALANSAGVTLLMWALLSSSFFAGQKHPSLPSSLVWNVDKINVVLPWTSILNRPLYVRKQWIRWQRRWKFEHDHRRRADRAPQTRQASRKTGDGHIGTYGGESLDRTEMVMKWMPKYSLHYLIRWNEERYG